MMSTALLTVACVMSLAAACENNDPAPDPIPTPTPTPTPTPNPNPNPNSKDVKTIKLDQTSVTIKIGEQATIKAEVEPADAAVKIVTWKSSNENVATVTNGGVVMGKSAGKATPTATAGKAKATCQVTVEKEQIQLEDLDVQISGSINHTTYTAGESGYVTFNRFPASVEEFKMVREQIGTEPHGAIALQVMAYEMYRRDKKIGEVCIRLNNTMTNISLPLERLRELFGGDNYYNRPYQMAAYLKGANPENGYNPTKPYTVEVTVDPGLKYVKSSIFQTTVLNLRIKSEGRLLSSKQGFDQVAVIKTKKPGEPSQGTYFIVQNNPGMYSQMAPISFDAEFKGLE